MSEGEGKETRKTAYAAFFFWGKNKSADAMLLKKAKGTDAMPLKKAKGAKTMSSKKAIGRRRNAAKRGERMS